MKFSIITPTHSEKNFPYLIELYESLQEQTYTEWEWILFLNNGLAKNKIPNNIQRDSKVKIIVDSSNENKIGAVKNKAFNCGTGDVLVEVDHDDLLMPTCLYELMLAFQDEQIGFVYSDSIRYEMKGKSVPYNAEHGWTYNTIKWRGEERLSMNHFLPSSHSLSYIWYSPDHVRAWRTSVYKELGGHDVNLSVCDDHDLCIRTYLHTKMKFLALPLYVYRVTGDNTWLERNKLIQDTTRILFDKYVRRLAEKDARDKGLLTIDIGGGLYPYPGYKTVDLRQTADIQADLNDGIPLPDNSVGVLNAHHILEHLKDPIKSMREIHRVLEHGGWAFIEVPSTDGRGAWQDPTHVSFWNINSFLYYTNKQQAIFIDNKEIRFQIYKLKDYFPSSFMKENNILVTCAVLVAIKKPFPRFPGILSI